MIKNASNSECAVFIDIAAMKRTETRMVMVSAKNSHARPWVYTQMKKMPSTKVLFMQQAPCSALKAISILFAVFF